MLTLINMDYHCTVATPLRQNAGFSSTSPYYCFDGLSSTPERSVFLSPSSLLQSVTKPCINSSPVFPGFQSPLGYSPSYISPLHQQQPLDLSNSIEKLKPNRLSAFSSPNDSFYLQRLKSNPMFQDLQSLLVQECLHMQVPTNLINTSWNTTPMKVPGVVDNGATVYTLHIKLQERLLSLRTDHSTTSKALEIESNYSCDVGKIEVSRYQGLCAAGMSETARLKVNLTCDEKRFELIKHVHADVNKLLRRQNANDSGMCAVSSPASQCSSRDGSGSDRCSPDIPSHDSGILSDDSLPEFPTTSGMQQSAVEKPLSSLNNVNTDFTISAVRHLNFSKSSFPDSLEFSQIDTDNLKLVISPEPNNQLQVNSQKVSVQNLDLEMNGEIYPPKKKGYLTECSQGEITGDSTSEENLASESVIHKSGDHLSKPECEQRNRLLTPEATVILSNWYDDHIRYPYPSDLEVKHLSDDCGISEKQVKKWMANKRVRCFNTLSISGNQHPIKLKYKGKRKHTNETARANYQQLSNESRDILTQWYEDHSYNPYPTEEEKEELAEKCQISIGQIRSWFANKRSRANNTRKQVPNYFIEKFPEYTPHVQMVSIQREQARRKFKRHESHMDFFYQNNYFM